MPFLHVVVEKEEVVMKEGGGTGRVKGNTYKIEVV